MVTPTFMLITDGAELHVEMGEVVSVPHAGERIGIDGVEYVVRSRAWDAFEPGKTGHRSPGISVTLKVKRWSPKRRRA